MSEGRPRFPFPVDCPIIPTDKGGSHVPQPVPSPAPAAAKEADLEDSVFWGNGDFVDFSHHLRPFDHVSNSVMDI